MMFKFHDANVPFYVTQHPKPNRGQAHRYLTNGDVMMVSLTSLCRVLSLRPLSPRHTTCPRPLATCPRPLVVAHTLPTSEAGRRLRFVSRPGGSDPASPAQVILVIVAILDDVTTLNLSQQCAVYHPMRQDCLDDVMNYVMNCDELQLC
jgi:hypothetical protein